MLIVSHLNVSNDTNDYKGQPWFFTRCKLAHFWQKESMMHSFSHNMAAMAPHDAVFATAV